MSLDQYNCLMSNMLNQRHALTKFRVKLEEREGRLCRGYRRFGHITQKYRSKQKKKRKTTP